MKKFFVGVALAIVFMISLLLIFRTPTNDRDWSLDQAVLPYAEFEGDTVHIKNIRNFEYRSTKDYTPHYYDRTVSVNDIVSVDYIVEPLASIAVAHTLLSFGLTDGTHIAISAEIRKEKGETFSAIRGLLEAYELMYVIADERDVLKLRGIHRENPVYLYPTIATPEVAQALFVSMLERANHLKENPRFYNTLTSNCTTNLIDHITEVINQDIVWDYRMVLPKESDALAYKLGFLGTDDSLETLREKYYVTDKIQMFADAPDFSERIRTTSD